MSFTKSPISVDWLHLEQVCEGFHSSWFIINLTENKRMSSKKRDHPRRKGKIFQTLEFFRGFLLVGRGVLKSHHLSLLENPPFSLVGLVHFLYRGPKQAKGEKFQQKVPGFYKVSIFLESTKNMFSRWVPKTSYTWGEPKLHDHPKVKPIISHLYETPNNTPTKTPSKFLRAIL